MASESKEGADGPVELARDRVLRLATRRDAMELEMDVLLEALGSVGLHEPLVDAEGFPRADVDVVAVRAARHRYAVLQTDYAALMTEIEAGLQEAFRVDSSDDEARGEGSEATLVGVAERGLGVEVSTMRPAAGGAGEGGGAVSGAAGGGGGRGRALGRPFARVNMVEPAGPAARAGFRVGDLLVRFSTGAFGRAEGTEERARRRGGDLGPDLACWRPRVSFAATAENTAELGVIAEIVRSAAGGAPLEVVVRRRARDDDDGDDEVSLSLSVPLPPKLGVHLVPVER